MGFCKKSPVRRPEPLEESAKIRVLLAAHIGVPRGGVSTYFETLINSDLNNYVDLHFIETSKGALRSGNRGKWRIINWFNALNNILRFLFALISVKPDLVHIGTAYNASFVKHSVMACLARMFFVPVIIQPHCSISKLLPENQKVWRKFALFILRQCEGVIILSKEWTLLGHLIPKTKIRYIPNAINVKPYEQLPRPRQTTNGKVNILYMGHITREKGIFDLIEASRTISKKNPRFVTDIVGECLIDEELCRMNEIINSNDLQEYIKIFGPEYGKKQIGRFASADIFVLPSYHEGMPMSVIEAMAAGLPVVASNVGGIPDLIENEVTGKLIAPGDVQALSSSLIELIENPEKRSNWGIKGRQKAVQHFDVESRVAELVSFYHDVCDC
jgi:glycosyltransferase involved in cell wall biosynthesis